MRLLLGSGGFRTQERIDRLTQEMRDHFGGITRLLFVPYALADHDGYVNMLYERGLDAGYEIVGIHTWDDPVEAVEQAEGIYVGGGNSFRLLRELYDNKLIEPIRERVHSGMPYLGVSAGTNVACPTIQTTNDMPITMPPGFAALNLFPWQINPHYYEGAFYVKLDEEYHAHYGETRDDRIREYHEMNDTPVIGLWEGGILKVIDDQVTLIGTGARMFHKGKESEDLPAGSSWSVQEK